MPADEHVPLDTRGTAAFEGHLGATLLRNGVPVRNYNLDSWWASSQHPIARLMRALTSWRKPA